MCVKLEPYQLLGETLAEFAERLWQVVIGIEERSIQGTHELEYYRTLLFIVEKHFILEKEANFVRRPPSAYEL